MSFENHTPMMKQYLTIKEEYKDCFLFYRLGDFYELFFEDAKTVAHLLELTLTSRNKNADVQVPMCGVPYHSAQRYINELIDMGYKVAICEQVEDPKTAKGMVKREVVQVVTPGTVMEESAIESKTNTFIGALINEVTSYALAYADLSTGEMNVTKMGSEDEVITEVGSLAIKEMVFFKKEQLELQEILKKRFNVVISLKDKVKIIQEFEHIYEDISENINVEAIQLLLSYLYDTQMRSLDHLQVAQEYETNQYLVYGQEARRNLELTQSLRDGSKKGTLLWLLDETQTAMGGRMLKKWLDKPLINRQEIIERQKIVENFMHHFFERSDLVDVLNDVYDLERLAGRIAYGTVNAKDLIQLKQSLTQIPKMVTIIKMMNEDGIWNERLKGLDPVPEVSELIEEAIKEEPPISITEGEIIKFGYHEKLDEYLDAMTNGKQWIANLQAKEREITGVKNLKVGFNKVFGYYIEVTKSNIDKINDERYERKQTLANSERYITPELKEKEKIILEAEEKSKALEYDLFIAIREEVKSYIHRIQELAKAVSEIDVLNAFAQVSEKYNYVKPAYHIDSQDILIKDGRHPVVEKVMNEQAYVPNDVELNNETDILLITGPNMSGKSTYMRQLALITIMGQMGCYIPASEAGLPIFDKIFTRIGAMDDLFGGQSTFMVEMNETNHALQNATAQSLLLFDEIGRGTATYDGMALAEAIIEHVHDNIGAKTLFSTHYHELTGLEERLERLENIHVGAVEEDGSLVFLHKMLPGPSDKSYGVQVAQLAGLPNQLINRASSILKSLEDSQGEHVNKSEVVKEEPTGQINLFEDSNLTQAEEEAISKLKDINVLSMTPLEALNLLNDVTKDL